MIWQAYTTVSPGNVTVNCLSYILMPGYNLDKEMNREASPNDIAQVKAMNEIAGDEAKTKAVSDEFSALIEKEIA